MRNISPYLIEGDDVFVTKRRTPIFFETEMSFGNMANDGGHLILSPSERQEIVTADPSASKFIKRLYGSQEFTKGIERWCIWIEDSDLKAALAIESIKLRVDAVRVTRSKSDRESTVALAASPHRFGEVRHQKTDAIIVPKNTSERRNYITAGFIAADCIISDLAFAVFNAKPYILSILSSRLHYVWGAAVGGRFKTDPRYSNTLVYNTFPFPGLSNAQTAELEDCAWRIITERESNAGKTIGELYDPETMPVNLLDAHQYLDDTLERFYIGRAFKNDTERLEHLFKLYAAMIKKEQSTKAPKKPSLIAKEAA